MILCTQSALNLTNKVKKSVVFGKTTRFATGHRARVGAKMADQGTKTTARFEFTNTEDPTQDDAVKRI